MKKLIYLILLLPFLSNAQNKKKVFERISIAYQFDWTGMSESSEAIDWNLSQTDRIPNASQSIQIAFQQRLTDNMGLQSGLSYSNRNMTYQTGFDAEGILIFDCFLPCGFSTVNREHRVHFSTLSADVMLVTEQHFGKFSAFAGLGIGLGTYLNFETKSIDIEESSPTFSEIITPEGNLNADGLFAFGKVQVGFLYNYSDWFQFFFKPTFQFDYTETKSEYLNNRFYNIGSAFGFSIKL